MQEKMQCHLVQCYKLCALCKDNSIFRVHINFEGGGDTFFENVGNHLQHYIVLIQKTTAGIFTVLRTSGIRYLFSVCMFLLLMFLMPLYHTNVSNSSPSSCCRIEQQLKTDQGGACMPDTCTPFQSTSDACKRLIRYHVFNEQLLSQQDLEKADEFFEATAKHLLDKFRQMMNKYRYLLLMESMVSLFYLSRLYCNAVHIPVLLHANFYLSCRGLLLIRFLKAF